MFTDPPLINGINALQYFHIKPEELQEDISQLYEILERLNQNDLEDALLNSELENFICLFLGIKPAIGGIPSQLDLWMLHLNDDFERIGNFIINKKRLLIRIEAQKEELRTIIGEDPSVENLLSLTNMHHSNNLEGTIITGFVLGYPLEDSINFAKNANVITEFRMKIFQEFSYLFDMTRPDLKDELEDDEVIACYIIILRNSVDEMNDFRDKFQSRFRSILDSREEYKYLSEADKDAICNERGVHSRGFSFTTIRDSWTYKYFNLLVHSIFEKSGIDTLISMLKSKGIEKDFREMGIEEFTSFLVESLSADFREAISFSSTNSNYYKVMIHSVEKVLDILNQILQSLSNQEEISFIERKISIIESLKYKILHSLQLYSSDEDEELYKEVRSHFEHPYDSTIKIIMSMVTNQTDLSAILASPLESLTSDYLEIFLRELLT